MLLLLSYFPCMILSSPFLRFVPVDRRRWELNDTKLDLCVSTASYQVYP